MRSGKKFWWLCKCGYEWKATPGNRFQGTGCPRCAGRKATAEYNFLIMHPELAKEWHTKKNADLRPENFAPFSDKKVWWRCKKGHEWETKILHRSLGRKCHYCTGQKVTKENSLLMKRPDLIKEWCSENTISPDTVSCGADKKVLWVCEFGHKWTAVIKNRTKINGTGCPYCYKLKKIHKNGTISLPETYETTQSGQL